MSFIANLQKQRNNTAPTPVVLPPPVLSGVAMDGLAGTFRAPNRFNAPISSQFAVSSPALTRQQLQRNYRG